MAEVVAQPVTGRTTLCSKLCGMGIGARRGGDCCEPLVRSFHLWHRHRPVAHLPYPAHSYGRAAASIAALWLLVVPIAAFLVGGYVARRMRTPREGADEAETEFRDGIHGALVWGVGILFGALLTFFAASATAQNGAAIGAAAADKSAVYTPALDTLFAPVNIADASPAAAPATIAAKTTSERPLRACRPEL